MKVPSGRTLPAPTCPPRMAMIAATPKPSNAATSMTMTTPQEDSALLRLRQALHRAPLFADLDSRSLGAVGTTPESGGNVRPHRLQIRP